MIIETGLRTRVSVINIVGEVLIQEKLDSDIFTIDVSDLNSGYYFVKIETGNKAIIEKIVVNIGAANEILTTVARGKFLKAINIEIKAIKPAKHLFKCNNGRLVL